MNSDTLGFFYLFLRIYPIVLHDNLDEEYENFSLMVLLLSTCLIFC